MSSSLESKLNEAAFPKGQYKSSYPDFELIAEHVPTGEEVLAIVRGALVGKKSTSVMVGADMGSFATLILTNKCLYMFGKSNAISKKLKRTESYTFATISGITRMKKVMTGWILEISRASNVDTYVGLDEKDSEKLYNALRELVAEAQKGNTGTVIHQAIDPMDQLKKLKDLLDAGVLSQAEFDEKKQNLLDKI